MMPARGHHAPGQPVRMAASGSDAAGGYPWLAMTCKPPLPVPRGPLAAANDNLADIVAPPPLCEWDVYWAARRGRFVGCVVATGADAAIRAAAVSFDKDIRKLIAVPRPALAPGRNAR